MLRVPRRSWSDASQRHEQLSTLDNAGRVRQTNYPSVYAIASSSSAEPGSPLPNLAQLQVAATDAVGNPTVTSAKGTIFRETITPELTLRISYSSGIDRLWCLWFYQQTNAGGQLETESLISPPGMYGTC